LASTNHFELLDAIGAAAESVVDGLNQSKKILDPKFAPQTKLHKLYSLDVQSRNTGKYRDHRDRQMRLAADVTLRVAWRLNPKDEALTQRTALRDEDNAIQSILTDSREPLPSVRLKYLRTQRQVNATREWLFAAITIEAEFDRSLTTQVSF